MADVNVPFDLQLEPTPAMGKGMARVLQCLFCGALVATTSSNNPKKLGPCPCCERNSWHEQTVPVGPFVHIPPGPNT